MRGRRVLAQVLCVGMLSFGRHSPCVGTRARSRLSAGRLAGAGQRQSPGGFRAEPEWRVLCSMIRFTGSQCPKPNSAGRHSVSCPPRQPPQLSSPHFQTGFAADRDWGQVSFSKDPSEAHCGPVTERFPEITVEESWGNWRTVFLLIFFYDSPSWGRVCFHLLLECSS